ncbi:MAG: GNAT family N-acetyltransferase [Candidatus Limnocylindria bacterium]
MTDRVIELARLIDAAEVAKLLRSAYADHAAAGLNFSAATATEDGVRERIARGQVYVARGAGRVIGTYQLRSKSDELGDAGYVNSLAVDPSLRGSGLGRALLEHAEAEVALRGLGRVRLDTAQPALALVSWYHRRGYRPVAQVRWPGKTYESVVLEKTLTRS